MDGVEALSATCVEIEREGGTIVKSMYTLQESLGHLASRVFAALYHLFVRPYWSRVWVIQEISQGQSWSPVLCGDRSIQWSMLYNAMLVLYNDQTEAGRLMDAELGRVSLNSEDLGARGFNRLGTIERCRSARIAQKSVHIIKILDSVGGSMATDPRDKLYALLGIEGFSEAVDIMPDYAAPIIQVVLAFQKSLIQRSRSLEILRLSSKQVGSHEGPSWSFNPQQPRLRSLLTNAKTPFSANNHHQAIAHFSLNESTLTCKGLKVDTVSTLSATTVNQGDKVQGINPTPLPVSKTRYVGHDGIKNALWRTIIADRTHRRAAAPPEWESICMVKYYDLLERQAHPELTSLQHAGDFEVFGQPLSTYFGQNSNTTDKKESASDDIITRFSLVLDRVFPGRRLATTVGGYLGLVPNETKVGDAICVILDCTTPLAICRMGEGYQLVGECYIHGIMNGEALKDWEYKGALENDLEDVMLM